MRYNETQRVQEAWEYYDKLLDEKLDRIAELSQVSKDHFVKLNPAEFIEKSRYQIINGYKYKDVGKWIREHKKDDTYLICPLDADEETAEQIGYKSRAGVTRKVRASKCEVVPVPKAVVIDFCQRNHRQSVPLISSSAVCLGLTFKNELLAIMDYDTTSGGVRGKKEGYELVRLAIAKNTQVHGGASKLQTACEEVLKQMGIERIFSYSNATINSGSVYQQLGFTEGRLDVSQPFVIMNDNRLVRLITLHPYSTEEELAIRHQFKSHIGGNKMWVKKI